MFTKTFSATHSGIEGVVVQIEAALQKALPQIHITGLAGEIIKESRERVRACLINQGFEIPSARIVVHLSPAQAKKQGSQLDLAIALSVLHAEGILAGKDLSRTAFLGELSLDGRLHRVSGAMALIQALENCPHVAHVIVPRENAWEAGVLASRKVRLAETITQALDFVLFGTSLPEAGTLRIPDDGKTDGPTLDEIRGQRLAKRALQIALAGRHHLLLVGPPGVGKSLLASTAATLLPPLDRPEWIELTKSRGPVTHGEREVSHLRPFRSPHPSISAAALLGGGSGVVLPGEVTLAHSGILFLDEFPEFRRDLIEGLREPLQSGRVHLHRVGHSLTLPARFTLIAAMNPCPCGYSVASAKRCVCSQEKLSAYRRRISGPILDRIDLGVVLAMPKPSPGGESGSVGPFPSHREVRAQIGMAIDRQRKRYRGIDGVKQNAEAPVVASPYFKLSAPDQNFVESVAERECLSFRSLHKWMRVARTIADLEGADGISGAHLQEAWGLRCPSSQDLGRFG